MPNSRNKGIEGNNIVGKSGQRVIKDGVFVNAILLLLMIEVLRVLVEKGSQSYINVHRK
jgi:hypothetical protein